MAFRKFGTFRTPHGWLTTTGDGEVVQRGTKRGDEVANSDDPHQFKVTIEDNKIKMRTGVVITGVGWMDSPNGPNVCTHSFKIRNVCSSSLDCTIGDDYFSEYVNENGTISLPESPSEGDRVWICIARNNDALTAFGRINTTMRGWPLLVVMHSADDGFHEKLIPWGEDGCDMVDWYFVYDTYEPDPMTGTFPTQPIYIHISGQNIQKTYNCQLLRIADVVYESGSWSVKQWCQGTVTLPHPFVYKGGYKGNNYPYWMCYGGAFDPQEGEILPTWRSIVENHEKQTDWESVMLSNDKGLDDPTSIID